MALGGLYGARTLQRQVGLLRLAVFGDGDRAGGSISETYTEVTETEVLEHTVTTENIKMLLDRADGGWWEVIKAELELDPLVLVDRAADNFSTLEWNTYLFRTIIPAEGAWTFDRVDGMPGHAAVTDDRLVGRALGIVGGALLHESHPVVALPKSLEVVPGTTLTDQLEAAAGKPPYDFGKVSGEAWLFINPGGRTLVVASASLTLGTYLFTFRVTDAMGATDDGVLTVEVVSSTP